MLILNDHLELVTPEQSKTWLTKNLYTRQRDCRLWHARLLAELMRAGKFRRGSKIEFCRFEDRLYLVDGQHTFDRDRSLGGRQKTGQICPVLLRPRN